jgi:hypothetical protein
MDSEDTFKPIFRSLLTSKQFQNEKCLKIWIWCLLKASEKGHTQCIGRQYIDLQPGEFIFGRYEAAKELNMSPSSVWWWMQWLQDDGSVDIKSNNKFSIIRICKWKEYRDKLDRILNNRKTTKRQQKDTINKDQKDNIDTKVSITYGDDDINSAVSHWKKEFGKNPPAKPTLSRYPLKRLIDAYTLPKVLGAITAVRQSIGDRYAPSINNPKDLEDKWIQLVKHYQGKKGQNGQRVGTL